MEKNAATPSVSALATNRESTGPPRWKLPLALSITSAQLPAVLRTMPPAISDQPVPGRQPVRPVTTTTKARMARSAMRNSAGGVACDAAVVSPLNSGIAATAATARPPIRPSSSSRGSTSRTRRRDSSAMVVAASVKLSSSSARVAGG